MTDQQMFDEAVRIVRQAGKPGLSMLMRGLQIKYNAAAKLMDEMEQAGVISPMQSDGNRILLKEKKHEPQRWPFAVEQNKRGTKL